MWNVASWDKDSAGKLPNQKLLSKVGSFAIYVNDNDNELQNNAGRPRTGDLVFDSIKLVGERDPYVPEEKSSEPSNAKLITIDDFESYADEAAMKEAWGNREHTDVLSLTTEDDDNKYLQYSNPHGGWLDVATFIQNDTARNNWTGLGKLTFRLKHDGSNNAMDLQIGTADGKYFHVDQKLASEDGADWKTVEIDLVNNPSLTQSWPEDENKGKTMTADDLALIKEVVIAGNTWTMIMVVNFAADDLKVVPSGDASDSKPKTKPEEPSEPTEPTEPEETPTIRPIWQLAIRPPARSTSLSKTLRIRLIRLIRTSPPTPTSLLELTSLRMRTSRRQVTMLSLVTMPSSRTPRQTKTSRW